MFETQWQILLVRRQELNAEQFRISTKQFINDLEIAWTWGRGRYAGFVSYLLILFENSPGFEDSLNVNISQANYRKALRRAYEAGKVAELAEADNQRNASKKSSGFDFSDLFGGLFGK